ncbi:MAG TPA: hypothetical protein VI248_29345 [Kineosporiaceae bacterium]
MIGRGALALIAVLLLGGCLAVLVEAQSESSIYFTGDRTGAVSQGGIIYYRFAGANYTITDDARGAADTTPVPVAVYVDPADPAHARVDGVTRWVDLVCVGVWFVAAGAVFPVAVRRQRRRRRIRAEFAAGDVALRR